MQNRRMYPGVRPEDEAVAPMNREELRIVSGQHNMGLVEEDELL